ncbi:MAG: TetR/AcrR family transcriptional regulator [Bacteroidetes bacterium]|nr:TetR/AcrR family transcriptional regulator [Bacteroidota bacterium]
MGKKEDVKNRIKEAAIRCFAQFGLEKTTLDDIARQVGLNKATFYYYYKNKEDIFLEVALLEGERFIGQLQQQTGLKKSAEQRIIFYLLERIRYYRDVLTVNKVSVETLARVLPRFFEMYESVKNAEISFIQQLLREGTASGELKKTDTGKLALALFNMSDAMKHKAEQDAQMAKLPVADYEPAILELQFLSGLIFKSLKNESK